MSTIWLPGIAGSSSNLAGGRGGLWKRTNQVERLAPSGVGEMSKSMSRGGGGQRIQASPRLLLISKAGGGLLLECSGSRCSDSDVLRADAGLCTGQFVAGIHQIGGLRTQSKVAGVRPGAGHNGWQHASDITPGPNSRKLKHNSRNKDKHYWGRGREAESKGREEGRAGGGHGGSGRAGGKWGVACRLHLPSPT